MKTLEDTRMPSKPQKGFTRPRGRNSPSKAQDGCNTAVVAAKKEKALTVLCPGCRHHTPIPVNRGFKVLDLVIRYPCNGCGENYNYRKSLPEGYLLVDKGVYL